MLEEGVAYYLTFKWILVILASLIALFTTFVVKWFLEEYWNIFVSWGFLFFLIWCLALLGLIYEFPVPDSIKERIHYEVYGETKKEID